MIIDIHAHYLPQSILDGLTAGAAAFPNVQTIAENGSFRFAFAGHEPTRPVMGKLRETVDRHAWLRERRIDLQLAGGWLDAFGYELAGDEGADWSRFMNESTAEAAHGVDDLLPLATVPMQDGVQAAAVLREAVGAGFVGAMIGTQPKGNHGNLDDPGLDPFWQAAAETAVPIFVHPMFGSDDTRLHDMGMMNAVGRVTDTTIAISRLLLSGHLTRYPGLKLVVATGGAALPFMLGRLVRNREVFGEEVSDPVEGFHNLYFDSIVFRTDALHFLCDLVGIDRVMMGSDYPFPIGDPAPTQVVEDSKYSDAEKSALLGGNARALFRL